jgi:hypothetical protein
MAKHFGGCHCGRIRFAVEAPAEIQAIECNCSVCGKSGYLHLIVAKSCFALIEGGEFLSTYTFGSGVARHLFCRVCGIKSFYVPRSNPDGYSINVRCLEPETITKINVASFDGKHWEESAAALAHLSKE